MKRTCSYLGHKADRSRSFEVESIADISLNEITNELQWLVKWKGITLEPCLNENWFPESEIKENDLIDLVAEWNKSNETSVDSLRLTQIYRADK